MGMFSKGFQRSVRKEGMRELLESNRREALSSAAFDDFSGFASATSSPAAASCVKQLWFVRSHPLFDLD